MKGNPSRFPSMILEALVRAEGKGGREFLRMIKDCKYRQDKPAERIFTDVSS